MWVSSFKKIILNPKSEYLNPKQIQNHKFKIPNGPGNRPLEVGRKRARDAEGPGSREKLLGSVVLDLGHLNLDIV